MFKKRVARSLRRKDGDQSDDQEAQNSDDDNSHQSNDIKILKSAVFYPSIKSDLPNRPSATSLLSFADEEEDTDLTFKVKKSTQSRKLEKMRQKLKAEIEISDFEMKPDTASIKTARTSSPPGQSLKAQEKSKVDKPIILAGKDAEAIDIAEEDMNNMRQKLSNNSIPDARLIHMARKQRQLARDTGDLGGPILAPLDDTQRYKPAGALTGQRARLIREDDDNDDEEGGIEAPITGDVVEDREEAEGDCELGGKFYSRARNRNDDERRRVESEFLNAEQGSEEENDDESDRWEMEQIRKGVSLQQLTTYKQEQMSAQYYYQQGAYGEAYGFDGSFAYNNQFIGPADPTNRMFGAPLPPEIELEEENVESKFFGEPQTMDMDIELPNVDDDVIVLNATTKTRQPKLGGSDMALAKSRIDFEALKMRIKERYDQNNAVVSSLGSDLEENQSRLKENETLLENIEKSQPELEEKLQFFHELRSYCRDLLECFNEKVEIINQLEDKTKALFTNRANFFMKRRQQDIRDQFDDISMAAVAKGPTKPDPDRMMRSSERETRKTRRRQTREKSTTATLAHLDGMSSDEEEAPSRIASHSSEMEKIKIDAADIWCDVNDEFCSLEKISDRFFQWKTRDPLGYKRAYGDLCLQKLLAPIVRSQMIFWNLADPNETINLEHFEWYQLCTSLDLKFTTADSTFKRDTPKMDVKNNDDDDPEKSIVDSFIEKVICPKLKDFITTIWDPISTQQTLQLSTFAKTYLLTRCQKFEEFTTWCKERIKISLDEDLFTPIYSREIMENKQSGASQFLDRQFWLAFKMIKNLTFWDKIFPERLVQELALDGVVNRHIVLNLQCSLVSEVSTVLKCKQIGAALQNAAWFTTMKKDMKQEQLEPLCKIIFRICEQIKETRSDKNDTSDTLKDLCRWLQKLGDKKYSGKLIDRYRLKI